MRAEFGKMLQSMTFHKVWRKIENTEKKSKKNIVTNLCLFVCQLNLEPAKLFHCTAHLCVSSKPLLSNSFSQSFRSLFWPTFLRIFTFVHLFTFLQLLYSFSSLFFTVFSFVHHHHQHHGHHCHCHEWSPLSSRQ